MNINLSAFPTTLDVLHVGLAILALLFFILFLVKGKFLPQEAVEEKRETASEAAVEAAIEEPIQEAPNPAELKETSADAALQLLALLQQDARFIDFVQEDLTGYSDADIGAAARVVHEGSKKTLNSYFTFEPIRSEEEESRITLNEGFNASEVRLTGNVVGNAPFTGTLVHKGWRVSDVKLPKLAEGHDTAIVASAEVEL
jgi:hypothetical protein